MGFFIAIFCVAALVIWDKHEKNKFMKKPKGDLDVFWKIVNSDKDKRNK